MTMRWMEARVAYDPRGGPPLADMITGIFNDFGVEGVILEDEDTGDGEARTNTPTQARRLHCVVGYFPRDQLTRDRRRAFESALTQSREMYGLTCRVIYNELDEKDWSESWKDFFWPEKIGSRLVVKPTWRAYKPLPDEYVIEIDPGMAFGTGTHPTSRLCIAMMEKYLKQGDTVLDVGTGSGILVIAAAKLGAGGALGVDTDGSAVKIARSNLLLNGLSADRYEVRAGDLVDSVESQYDIVVANIAKAAILSLLAKLRKVMPSRGVFICSGILKEQRQEIADGMAALGLAVLEVQSEKEWASIACRHRR